MPWNTEPSVNLGPGGNVYVSATEPTGRIPPNSLWLELSGSNVTGVFIWNGNAWAAAPFNASDVLETGTIIANLIAAGTVVAGIINGTTVQAAQYIADGTSGEFLIYASAPAAGNLVLSVSPVAGADSHGNTYKDGIGIYHSTGVLQLHVNATVGAPALELPTGVSTESAGAAIYSLPVNTGLADEFITFRLNGPSSTRDGQTANLILSSSAHDGSSIVGGILNCSGVDVAYWQSNGIHVEKSLFGTGGILSVGDSVSMASGKFISADSWHPITLDSGWIAASGFDAPRYRILPDGNLQLAGAASRTAFTSNIALNSSNPLPAAYQPTNTHHYRGYDTSTGTARCGVQIAPNGILTALATASSSSSLCEIDGIIPLN